MVRLREATDPHCQRAVGWSVGCGLLFVVRCWAGLFVVVVVMLGRTSMLHVRVVISRSSPIEAGTPLADVIEAASWRLAAGGAPKHTTAALARIGLGAHTVRDTAELRDSEHFSSLYWKVGKDRVANCV